MPFDIATDETLGRRVLPLDRTGGRDRRQAAASRPPGEIRDL